MISSLSPAQLLRYKRVLGLFLKHGRADLLRAAKLEDLEAVSELEEQKATAGKPEALVADLEKLGPTFIKVGQMLASRPDLLPPAYVDALSKLHDNVEPFPYEQVEEIVSNELGVRISTAFDHFDKAPIAAASLGQVHKARLKDGREMAVKVQRPDIRGMIREDLEVFDEIAGAIDRYTKLGERYPLRDIVAQFRRAIYQELDYRQEAQNLITLSEALSDHARIKIPAPVLDFTSNRVLTMEFLDGFKVTELPDVTRTELDTRALAVELCKGYLDQVLVAGFFHADPHPGNVLVTQDQCIGLIDVGMVAHVDPDRQRHLLKLILAISDGRGRETAELGIEMGEVLDGADTNKLKRDVADLVTQRLHAVGERRKMGRVMMDLARLSAENGVRPSPEVALLGKTLLNLDQIGQALDEEFDPDSVVRDHAHVVMRQYALGKLKPSRAFAGALELQALLEKLPRQINSLMEAVTERKLQVKIDAFDEERLTANLEKIANRIAMGLVLAALIVGAALMMRVESELTLFGYPAVATVLFLFAAAIGFGLVIRILIPDSRGWRRDRKR